MTTSRADLLAKRSRLYKQIANINSQLQSLDSNQRLHAAATTPANHRNDTSLTNLVSKPVSVLLRRYGYYNVADLPSDLSELLTIVNFGPLRLMELTQALDALQPT